MAPEIEIRKIPEDKCLPGRQWGKKQGLEEVLDFFGCFGTGRNDFQIERKGWGLPGNPSF